MKILSTTLQTVIMVCLLALGGVFVSSMLPIPGGLQSKIVQSGSMEPHIPTGSLVVIKPAQSYAVGDVITFNKQGPVPTTHRIAGIEGSGEDTRFVTRGDANEEADPGVVPQARVLGKVVLSLPYVGYILHAARQPMGFALLIALPAFLVIVEEVASLWGVVRARRAKIPVPPAPERQRVSDDMFKYRVVQHQGTTKRMLVMSVGALLVVTMLGGGQTLAALSDTEKSTGNILAATTWEPLVVAPFVNPFMLMEPQMLVVEDDAASSSQETASTTEPLIGEEATSTPEAVVPAPEPEPEPEAVLPPEEQATPQQEEAPQD